MGIKASAASARVDLPAEERDWTTAPSGRSLRRLVSVNQVVRALVRLAHHAQRDERLGHPVHEVGRSEQRECGFALVRWSSSAVRRRLAGQWLLTWASSTASSTRAISERISAGSQRSSVAPAST